MLELIERHKLLVTVGAFLLVAFGLMVFERGRTNGNHGPVARLAGQPTGLAQSVLADSTGGIAGFWDRHMQLVGVNEENARLREELDRVREERVRLLGVMQENARLRALVGFAESHAELELVPARVIARDVNSFFRVVRVRIDADTHRLRENMPVVTSAGLVGSISEVDGRYAEVMLTVDARSSVDVVVQRNRARGILEGRGHDNDYDARIAYLLRREQVEPGDLVVTSGVDGRFPPDLVAGRIAEVHDQTWGLFQEVRVEPVVDFGRLEEVYVIVNTEER